MGESAAQTPTGYFGKIAGWLPSHSRKSSVVISVSPSTDGESGFQDPGDLSRCGDRAQWEQLARSLFGGGEGEGEGESESDNLPLA